MRNMIKVRLLLLVITLFILMVSVSADETFPTIFEYTNPEITVMISAPTDISSEHLKTIADEIVGIEPDIMVSPSNDSPSNIICTLLGHNLSPEVTVTATHHKVETHHPRCLMEIYHVVYCKRCDYTESSLEDSFYIVCCPED